ncbi:MAG: hypothetical protein HYV96_10315 [Opitutae bacterium]|nr:hypothetical protein [Opitutae bacterium]
MKPSPQRSPGKVVRGQPLLPSSIVTLLAGCPVGDTNPDHCPLYEVRKLPPQEALDWVASLSTDDKAFLLQYHRCCLVYSLEEQRTNRVPGPPRRARAMKKKTPTRSGY